MAERLKFAGQIVRRGTGLNANQTWWHLLEERKDMAALQLPARTNTWPAASTPCTWKTDLAMSKPIV
ncbi:hypothetical protein JQ611_13985 [Bradyrhizobium sp. AUGA SZCCT0182]|nr:hypothetical protein [Bradyrhizobium sp. AUGA SZCCT0182]